jgi:hypothetical protein
MQACWEGPYIIITRVKDVICRIQRCPRAKIMVVHLYRLAPYLRSEQSYGWVVYVIGTDVRFLPDCDVCVLL